MIDLLFICQWNIARSQIAEWFAKKIYLDINVNSCWIDDVWYKYDFKCYEPAISLMNNRNIDISWQSPKVITEKVITESKKIIVLCNEYECKNSFPLYLKNHSNVIYLDVLDPNMKSIDFLENTINKIEKIVKELT